MQKVMKFTNFSNEDFTGYWDGTPWEIKKGETIMLQAYLANHFAKHLIDRELNKIDEPTSNQLKRAEMGKKCLGDVVAEVESKEKAETEVLNQDTVSAKMSRKELNKIAKDEGINEPEKLSNRQEVVDMINDTRDEDEDEDMPPNEPIDETEKDDKNEEDDFEGNDEKK